MIIFKIFKISIGLFFFPLYNNILKGEFCLKCNIPI